MVSTRNNKSLTDIKNQGIMVMEEAEAYAYKPMDAD
jgi:hypothetical protein